MRMAIALLAAILLAAPPLAAAETVLAEPKPGWDNPRKIVLQLTEDDPKRVNTILHNAVNLQKFYGQDMVKVAIVAYGPGIRALLAESSPVADRISSLRQYEVEFLACGNTLETMGKGQKDLLPGVAIVTTGIAEIVERQLQGWHYIAP